MGYDFSIYFIKNAVVKEQESNQICIMYFNKGIIGKAIRKKLKVSCFKQPL